MSAIKTKVVEWSNVRWMPIELLADGSKYTQAWSDPNRPNDSFVAEAKGGPDATDLEVLDALRVQILKHLKKPTDQGIRNGRGDTILVGGGYR